MSNDSPLRPLIARLEALRALLHDAHKAVSDPLDLGADWQADHPARLARYHAHRDALRASAQEADPLARLSHEHGLDALEEDLLLLALAPSLDQGFVRLLSGVRRSLVGGRADLDLALSLLTPDLSSKLSALRLLDPQTSLVRAGLLTLRTRRGREDLLGLQPAVPERVQRLLLGHIAPQRDGEHAALVEPARPWASVCLPEDDARRLEALLEAWPSLQGQAAPRLGLILAVGPSGTGKTSLAEAIAARLGRPLLRVEGGLAGVDPVGAVAEAVTEARVTGALLCFDDGELWFAHRMQGNRALPALLRALEGYGGLVVLTTSMEGMLDASVLRRVLVRVDLGFPTPRQRGALWRSALPQGQARESLDLDFIAEKYEFTGAQIEAAAAMATAQAWTRAKREGAALGLRAEDVEQAAKGQLQHHLAQLAVRTVTHLTLEDIVLPDDLKRILRSVLSAVRNRRRIFEEWGLGERVTTGQGLAMLFRGESGTGKTLSAEILASELAMPLYRIAIPKIVSKYIGETEKNLEKAFREAQVAGAMLLFDEADAIFTKRVEVNNANDRYSNMEVNLLLQELERFDGVVILTTNLDAAIDDAFERRLNYKLDFPFPDGASRALIWRRLLPPRAPIDLSEEHIQYLGEQFELSGGSIKNVMVRASYAAAEAGGKLDIDRLEGAAIQEYRELGKLVGGL